MSEAKPTRPGAGVVNAAAQRGVVNRNAALTTVTKSYVVTGPRKVGGVATGGTVSLTLTADQEKHLVDVGHIRLAP